MKKILLTACLAMICLSGAALAQNLIINGDFELGNSGFTTNYIYSSAHSSGGVYCIDVNPVNCYSGYANYNDHTTGNGRMMIVNGSHNSNATVWQQTISVSSYGEYIFSGWVASLGNEGGTDPSPATLRFFINDIQIGNDFTATATDGVWSQFSMKWNSDVNTSATIKIVDTNLASYGNDFSLDDLSFVSSSVCTDSCKDNPAGCGLFTEAQLKQAVKAEQLKWDANGDGKIGLEDIIRMLQVIAGLRP